MITLLTILVIRAAEASTAIAIIMLAEMILEWILITSLSRSGA